MLQNARTTNTVESTEEKDHIEAVFIPNPEDSGDSDCNDDSSSSPSSDKSGASTDNKGNINSHVIHQVQSYRKVSANYNANQKKMEDGHAYQWIDGEAKYDDDLSNNVLLSQTDKKKKLASSPTDLFGIFFSETWKK